MTNNTEDQKRVRRLNDTYGGPIIFPQQGAQPKVDREALIEWWNGLEAQWEANEAKRRDAQATVENQYDYGGSCP